MQNLLEEIKRDRKLALFNTSVMFDENRMNFSPDEKDIADCLINLLEDMVSTMNNSSLRLLGHFENFVKNLNVDNIFDVQTIIFESVDYKCVKEELNCKVKKDFENANNEVKEKYEKCRPIHNFKSIWNFDTFREEE